MCGGDCFQKSEGKLRDKFFHGVDLSEQTKTARQGSEHHYPLGHLARSLLTLYCFNLIELVHLSVELYEELIFLSFFFVSLKAVFYTIYSN